METARSAADHFGAPAAFDDPFAMAKDPSVDAVAVCVRVPEHRRLVLAALEAGKHVYCEWPLAANTSEADDLVALAAGRNLVNMVGLQARMLPEIQYLRDLIAEGAIGELVSTSFTSAGLWPVSVPPGNEYLQKAESGGNFLTIEGGHGIDAFCHVVGRFARLSANCAIKFPTIELIGGGTTQRNTPDHVTVNGTLANGALASFEIRGLSAGGSGLRFEVNGTKGSLLLTATGHVPMIQMSPLTLSKVAIDGALETLTPPDRYYWADRSLGPVIYGVAQLYERFADAIEGKGPVPSDFQAALVNHRLIDAVVQAAEQRRDVDI
jgi:predicted dehydrogenase